MKSETPYTPSISPMIQDSLVFSISFPSKCKFPHSPFPSLRSPRNFFFPKSGKTTHGISFQKVKIILSSVRGYIENSQDKSNINQNQPTINIEFSCPNSSSLVSFGNELPMRKLNWNEEKEKIDNLTIYELASNDQTQEDKSDRNFTEMKRWRANLPNFEPNDESKESNCLESQDIRKKLFSNS
jgi:hypothetical protein